MTELSRIVDQLEREFDGDPWHGTPLEAILQGIDAKRAAARPIAGGHSIWELVLHMIGWKDETTRRLAGGVARMPAEGDWPAIGEATDERWQQALARLDASHRARLKSPTWLAVVNTPSMTGLPRTTSSAASARWSKRSTAGPRLP